MDENDVRYVAVQVISKVNGHIVHIVPAYYRTWDEAFENGVRAVPAPIISEEES